MMRRIFSYLFLLLPFVYKAQADSVKVYSTQEDSVAYKVVRLALNTPQADYSPFMSNNALYFVSTRPSHTGVTYSSANSEEGLSDVYRAAKKDSVRFKHVAPFSEINSPYNEGPFCLSKDGRQIYYTGNKKQAAKRERKTLLKLFYSAYDGKSWSTPQEPAFCKEDVAYGHPALSPDQQTLVFSSDLPGGYGGMDLYASYLKDGSWSLPVNLGPEVNTASHEVFPFISEKGALYFSSSRAGGLGGLDLYAINRKDTADRVARLLPSPINSVSDDFGIWLDSTALSGYFSSNRQGNDDIYYFGSAQPDFSRATVPAAKTSFCYTFFEETAVETADSTGFFYEWNLGDGTRSRQLHTRHCYTKPGTYQVSLNAVEKVPGGSVSNEVSYELVIEPPPGLYMTCADSVPKEKEVLFDSERCRLKGFEIKQVYWDFGDGRYGSGPYVKHRYAKSGEYAVMLGVVAVHTEDKHEELFKTIRHITIIEH